MSDPHQDLLKKITDIKSDSPCPSSYEDTERYRGTLETVSNLLEDEIEKLKSRIA
jgi:hypothetical protein